MFDWDWVLAQEQTLVRVIALVRERARARLMSHRGEDGVTAWSGSVKREDRLPSLLLSMAQQGFMAGMRAVDG